MSYDDDDEYDDEDEFDHEFDDSDAFVKTTNGYVGDAEQLLRRAIDVIATAPTMPLSSSPRIDRDEIIELLEAALHRMPEEMLAFYLSEGIDHICFNVEESEGSHVSALFEGAELRQRYAAFLRRFWHASQANVILSRRPSIESACVRITRAAAVADFACSPAAVPWSPLALAASMLARSWQYRPIRPWMRARLRAVMRHLPVRSSPARRPGKLARA